MEQLILCVAAVEPFERDLGRKLIRECPAQEALKDFLQTESNGQSTSESGYNITFNQTFSLKISPFKTSFYKIIKCI